MQNIHSLVNTPSIQAPNSPNLGLLTGAVGLGHRHQPGVVGQLEADLGHESPYRPLSSSATEPR